MKILFTVWLLIGGNWVHGSMVDGWSPILADSEQECMRLIEFSEGLGQEGIKFTCEEYNGKKSS